MNTRSLLVIFLLITVIASFCLSGCAGENSSVGDDDVHQFIVNKRTGKIHSEDCPAVVQMNEKNKLYASDSLLNLLKQDYVVCRRCRAGFDKTGADGIWQHLLHKNLYTEEFEIEASREDYLKAVGEISEWYVDHVPTYAAGIQDESFSKYNGSLTNYKEYTMKNKGKTSTHNVISSDINASSLSLLKPDDEILRGTENAACYYNENIKQIDFKRHIAYYPCNLLDAGSDYSKPGDDCVRYVFAVLNRMDNRFTDKYALLSDSSYSKTDSKMMATDYKSIAYGFINLGFKIFDSEQQKVYVDNDSLPEGYIFPIDDDFRLQKGDILAREGHVHIYLGDGMAANAANFGWGRVYRSYPQTYRITVKNVDGHRYISLINSAGTEEAYPRVYRYTGNNGGVK